MNLLALRSVSALGLAVLLTACGGGQVDQSVQTAAVLQSGEANNMAAQLSSPGSTQVSTQVSANMPAPDCAADGCKGLRIIDANAEAYRYEAMRRAAADNANS
jgi:hypothetical protein